MPKKSGPKPQTVDEQPAELPEGAKWKGNPLLIPFLVPVSSIFEDPANARVHPERSINDIAGSYARFGQQKFLVLAHDMTVRDGNGQFRAAAQRLGWTHIAAIPSDLEGVELSAYAVAVNQSAASSEWNYEMLAEQLRGIRDAGASIDDLSFEPFELEPLLQASWKPDEPEPAPQPPADSAPSAPPSASNVRMVQLFLTTDTYPEFASMVETLRDEYGTENATDTVMECLSRATAEGDADPE